MDQTHQPPTADSMIAPPDEHAAEHVAAHVARYKAIGGILLLFTGVTVALSYFNFGSMKVNIAVAMLVATVKGTLVALNFMHLSAEKRLIYRILIFTVVFVLGLFWLTYLAWYNPIVR